jgi:hypothetical protein
MCGWTNGGRVWDSGTNWRVRTSGGDRGQVTTCPNPPMPVRAHHFLCGLSAVALARRPIHRTHRPGRATGISTGRAPRDTVRRSHFHAQVHYPPPPRRPCPVELSTPPPFPAHAPPEHPQPPPEPPGSLPPAPAPSEESWLFTSVVGYLLIHPVENPPREWISGPRDACVGGRSRSATCRLPCRSHPPFIESWISAAKCPYATSIHDSASRVQPNATTRRNLGPGVRHGVVRVVLRHTG